MTIREAIAERIALAEREYAALRQRASGELPDASEERLDDLNRALMVHRERLNGMRMLRDAVAALLPKEQ